MQAVAFDVSEVLVHTHISQIEHLNTIHFLDLSQSLTRRADSHTVEQQRLTAIANRFH